MGDSRHEGPSRTSLPTDGPGVCFYSLFGAAPLPQPARDVLPNALPLAAVQRCPPVTTASSLGWVLRPRVPFGVRWTGDSLHVALVDAAGDYGPWRDVVGDGPLSPDASDLGSATDPERAAQAREIELDQMPLLDPSPFGDPREFQYLSGIVAVTNPGWALLVRSVPNWPRARGDYDVVEGVVETAWAGNVLPVMLRLRSEGVTVRFDPSSPLAVLHPVPVAAYTREHSVVTASGRGIDAWPQDVWDRFLGGRRARMAGRNAYRTAQANHYRDGAEQPEGERRG